MAESSAEQKPEPVVLEERSAEDDAARAKKWRLVRPAAIAILCLSAGSLVVLLALYLRSYGSFDAAPDSPRIGLAILLGVLALMAAAVIVFRPEQGTVRALVSTSAAWSVALLLAVIVAWFAIATVKRQDQWHGAPMLSQADVNDYLAKHVPAGVEPILIPTGVLLKSLEFLNGDNVQVTGYVWQRFGPEIPDDLIRGLILAEGTRDPFKQTEAYRYEKDGIETVGWYFETVLRQPFEYAEFPFDMQDVWLRLWSRDFAASTVLIPDFASYASLGPKALPGLEKEFVYSGWTPNYSGFTLSLQPYTTSFGIGTAEGRTALPELYFNLIIDRNFVGPFFEHFVFALAVAILLFGLMALTTDDEALKARFQLTTAGVLGASSGLLFAVILKHNQLRNSVGSNGVSYIELIPIILYGVIVVVVVNAIVLASPFKLKVVHHRSNLVPVLAYWPTLLGLILIATLIVFFRP